MAVAVIQARMSSTRLPGKVLGKLGNRSLLGWVIRAAQQSRVCDEIIVATTSSQSDDAVVAEAVTLGVSAYRGDTEDVLSRFLGALSNQAPDEVFVRLTADCPLLDPELIAMTVRAFELAGVDYLSTILTRTLPRGLDVEVSRVSVLRACDSLATGYQRSHVTPAIYEHPGRFLLAGISFRPAAADLRVTVDTPEDLAAVSEIVRQLGDEPPRWSDVVQLLRDQPEIRSINAHIEQKELSEG